MKRALLTYLLLIAGICLFTINTNIPAWQAFCGGLCCGFAAGGKRA